MVLKCHLNLPNFGGRDDIFRYTKTSNFSRIHNLRGKVFNIKKGGVSNWARGIIPATEWVCREPSRAIFTFSHIL